MKDERKPPPGSPPKPIPGQEYIGQPIPRGVHGLCTVNSPCPKCGETGHEVALVLGLRAILCPNSPLGEIEVCP